jgi:hypothetical protein
MDRRTFLTRMGAASAALALPTFAHAFPAQAMGGAHTNFHFLTIAANPAGTDMLVISGDGAINPAQAVGGGFWQHFDNDPALPLPKPVIGCGSWHVKRLDRLDLIGDWGCAAAGTVVMGARFVEESGLRFSARVTMNCNLGFAGLSTGLPEGAFVDIPDFGISFEPATFPGGFPFGLTVFTNINESSEG